MHCSVLARTLARYDSTLKADAAFYSYRLCWTSTDANPITIGCVVVATLLSLLLSQKVPGYARIWLNIQHPK